MSVRESPVTGPNLESLIFPNSHVASSHPHNLHHVQRNPSSNRPNSSHSFRSPFVLASFGHIPQVSCAFAAFFDGLGPHLGNARHGTPYPMDAWLQFRSLETPKTIHQGCRPEVPMAPPPPLAPTNGPHGSGVFQQALSIRPKPSGKSRLAHAFRT